MRLIDADALKEAILEEREYIREEEYKIKRDFMLGGLRRALRCLEEAPTVEERPRGEWINHLDLTEDYCGESKQCSLCGYTDYNTRRFLWHKFCPNCGADMRGEGE